MADLGPVAWPPEPIRTERLVLREPEARDRAAFIELLASPEVRTYLGGPRPRDELEREMPEAPGRRPGHFVVDLDGAMIGRSLLDRRDESVRSPGCRGEGRSRLPVPAGGVGMRVRRRGVRGGTRLVRRRASRRAGGALPPRPPTSARCASRRSWGSPRWSGSRTRAPSSGSACGPRSRRPVELVLDGAADPRANIARTMGRPSRTDRTTGCFGPPSFDRRNPGLGCERRVGR